MTDTPATASRTEFARLQGWRPSYVTQLAREGRLVFVDAAERIVDVAASVARVRATMDPARSGVVDRHRKARAKGSAATAPSAAADAPTPPPAAHGGSPSTPTDGNSDRDDDAPADALDSSDFQLWRARDMRAKALAAERDLAVSLGNLIKIDEAAAQIRVLILQFGQGLETAADTIAQRIAPGMSEEDRRAVIAEEHALLREQLARGLQSIAKEETK